MAQYIDKSALVAEINQRIEDYKSHKIDDSYHDGLIFALEDLKDDFLDTLQVKEVDLEKHLKEDIDDEWCDEWSGDVGNWIRCRRGTTSMEVEDVKDIAKHFFELGMQQSKNHNNNEE